ncbi:winged helix-turn-helix domain-containing protein, partial [Kitasatospora aureofaciens]
HGWSAQVPARRALERDGGAVEAWKEEVWPRVEALRRPGTMPLGERGPIPEMATLRPHPPR